MTGKVGPKGQVVIPKVMRDRLGITPGDEVQFELEDGGVRVERAASPTLRGRFANLKLTRTLEADHRRERSR